MVVCIEHSEKIHITKRSRGIWHAWHFYYALSSVFMALCGSFCIACQHPLTRRYVFRGLL
nr:DUF3265 domain-containing protein [Vibrio kanaloae]